MFVGAAMPRLVVLVAPESREQVLAVFAAGRINNHLTTRRLAVVDDKTLGQLALGDRSMLGLSGNGNDAAVAQADVILVLSVRVDHKGDFGELTFYQAEVGVEARIAGALTPLSVESYSSREISFAATYDREKARRACVEEAVGGAIRPVMQTVLRAVKDEQALGRVYTLRVRGDGARLRSLETILSAKCKESSATQTPDGSIVTVRYRGQLDELISDLESQPDLNLTVSGESARTADFSIDP